MSGYPRDIMAAYAGGGLTRAQFMSRFAAWQRSRGMDYTCRGYAYPGMTGVTYRGRSAVISGGTAVWASGEYRDERGERKCAYGTARSVTEFKRMVDFAMLMAGAWLC